MWTGRQRIIAELIDVVSARFVLVHTLGVPDQLKDVDERDLYSCRKLRSSFNR